MRRVTNGHQDIGSGDGYVKNNRAAYPKLNQFFFTNSDLSFIGPKPSILQSIL